MPVREKLGIAVDPVVTGVVVSVLLRAQVTSYPDTPDNALHDRLNEVAVIELAVGAPGAVATPMLWSTGVVLLLEFT